MIGCLRSFYSAEFKAKRRLVHKLRWLEVVHIDFKHIKTLGENTSVSE